MVNYTATVYLSPATLKVAVDAIANTVTIHVISFMEAGQQKFMLIV